MNCWSRSAGEVLEWQGVTTGDTGRGGLQFYYGRVELGHLHGSSFAAAVPEEGARRTHSGRAGIGTPTAANWGWVRRKMDGPADAQAVIELFRMNYDRARARAERRAASEDE